MNHQIRNKKSISLITAFFLFLFMTLAQAEMKEACDLLYPGYLSEIKDSMIRVPDKVVSMHAPARVEIVFNTSGIIVGPGSIFLLIQHSESIEAKDKEGKRFTFAQSLIDTLMKRFPKTEIGIGIFRTYLYFDPADNPRFVKAPGNDTGSYLPFFRLDSAYAPDGKLGYEIVRELIDTAMVNGTANLKYIPSNLALNLGNTNINCGFDAVKHAFKSANTGLGRQYVIFISDGEANTTNGPHTNVFDYSDNAPFLSDVPTTFTAYFSNSGTAHPSLVKTNINIQNNSYSYMNPRSALHPISSDTLMNFIFNNIVKIIIQPCAFKPKNITINGITSTTYDSISHMFFFNEIFPLTGLSTIFNYKITYTVTGDSIDTVNGDTIVIPKDSTTSGSYTVLVDPTVSNPPTNYKHLFDMICWKRELALYYNGTPVKLVNMAMNNLELRFMYSPYEAYYHYTNADVEVSTTTGANKDQETYTLIKTDTVFTQTMSLAIDSNPTPNNGVLQVHENDTIIAVFRNDETPHLPLDTLRIAVPFVATAAIQSTPIISTGILSFNLVKNGVGKYFLKYSNLPADGKIKLYTINGRKVFERQLIKGNSSIELPKVVSHSIYLLQVHCGGKVCKKKVLLR